MLGLLTLLLFSFVGIYMNVWFLLLIFENRTKFFKKKLANFFPSISVLIPAYNEEKEIAGTLDSVLSVDYPKEKLEVIVIDNGSTDKTSEIVKKFKEVKLIKLPNPGKADALNAGLEKAKGEIVGILDADTRVLKSSLKKMVGYFSDSKVGAVTNFIRVDSNKGILPKLQNIEYLISAISKKILSILDSYYITPGTLSLIRKNLAKEIKFSSDTLTEDMDIALSILKKGYKIVNCLDSTVFTDIPKTFKKWAKQRIRWYRGYIENTIKHKDILFSDKNKTLGCFIIPVAGYVSITIGILLTGMLFFDTFYRSLLTIKSFAYIPLADQLILAMESFPKITSLIYQPYYLISYIIIFSTSFFVISLGLKLLKSLNKANLILLPFYMFFYYTLIMVCWFYSILLEATGARKRW